MKIIRMAAALTALGVLLLAQIAGAQQDRRGADELQKYREDKNPEHCKIAEKAYTEALQQFPENAAVAYGLGCAQVCLYKLQPEKISSGLYEMARAVALDPTLGGTANGAAIEKYLTSIYTQYHGPDEVGLAHLKELAKTSSFPPTGFHIEQEVSYEGVERLGGNVQLAMWLGVKKALNDQGEQYFHEAMKDYQFPPMKGTLVAAKPACRSKELLVAISDTTHPEITLKMVNSDSKAVELAGKPTVGSEIQWAGVPKAFTKDPFMVSMEVEVAKIENLKMSPCGAALPKTPPKRKQ